MTDFLKMALRVSSGDRADILHGIGRDADLGQDEAMMATHHDLENDDLENVDTRPKQGAVDNPSSSVPADMDLVSVMVGISWDQRRMTQDEAVAKAKEIVGSDGSFELVQDLGPGSVVGNLEMPKAFYEKVEQGRGFFSKKLDGVKVEFETP